MSKGSATVKLNSSLTAALTDLILDKQHEKILAQFVRAFALRRKFSWLGESGTRQDQPEGLVYALRYALVTYVPTYVHVSDPRVIDEGGDVDNEWREQLLSAAIRVGSDPTCVEQFGEALALAGVGLDADSQTIGKHLSIALEAYSERRWSGTTPDPW